MEETKIYVENVCTGTELHEQVWQLREEILRQPLGLSLRDEDPAEEANDITLAAVADGRVIGCIMMRSKDATTVKLRQMAVAESMQGKGIGKILVSHAEDLAKAKGYVSIKLHARMTAVPFYEKLGYSASGDVFTEVSIPHVLMQKEI